MRNDTNRIYNEIELSVRFQKARKERASNTWPIQLN